MSLKKIFYDKYPFVEQPDWNDCGPTCMKMILKYYGVSVDLAYLRSRSNVTYNGASLLGMSDTLEGLNLNTLMLHLELDKLKNDLYLPSILHWNNDHFVVLYRVKVKKHLFKKDHKYTFVIADPSHNGLVEIDEDTFKRNWINPTSGEGIALMIYPKPNFFSSELEPESKETETSYSFLYKYVRPYKKYLLQIVLGMGTASILSLVFPFLTQAIVDYGIVPNNLSIIGLIVLAQVALFFGQIGIEILRNRILLHTNSRISISVISDFLAKLMKLPISFFETRSTGDLSQRIQDHKRIEEFLTGTSLITFFSLINIVVFTTILFFYDPRMFLLFLLLSVVSIIWILFFLKKRRSIDYKRFKQLHENQDTIFEILLGIKEIKLNGGELSRRWKWERGQFNLFNISLKGLLLDQYQIQGFTIITQLKNILVSYLAAILVVNGDMTLGMMLSVTYIIGQTNGPLSELALFFRTFQDAKISLSRLNEIHSAKNEEDDRTESIGITQLKNSIKGDIVLDNVKFQYGTRMSKFVLDGIDLSIPENKITAVVGTSGSGKTTLLRLLLKFYEVTEGRIVLDNKNIQDYNVKQWRQVCGTVMQDGYIFGDSIANNIAIDGERIDLERLNYAVKVACLDDVIEENPAGLARVLSAGGGGLSGGQKQRLLIARAVYKNPKYLFFDEATSSLDANTERDIIENLNEFFEGKTVFIIAHRLSTVKHADQIVVLSQGKIIENGSHEQLISLRGEYYNLVKNQLEIGNE